MGQRNGACTRILSPGVFSRPLSHFESHRRCDTKTTRFFFWHEQNIIDSDHEPIFDSNKAHDEAV